MYTSFGPLSFYCASRGAGRNRSFLWSGSEYLVAHRPWTRTATGTVSEMGSFVFHCSWESLLLPTHTFPSPCRKHRFSCRILNRSWTPPWTLPPPTPSPVAPQTSRRVVVDRGRDPARVAERGRIMGSRRR